MIGDREEQIRKIAYLLWEQEGSPEGQSDRHWRMAEDLLEQAERKDAEGEPPGEPVESEAPFVAGEPPRAAADG